MRETLAVLTRHPTVVCDLRATRSSLPREFLVTTQVRPWMTAVGAFGQLPLWITFFFTMRHLVREGAGLGLETGGMLWFADLTQRDPYYVLPLITGASFYGMIQLGDPGQAPGAPLDPRQAQMRTVMKFIAPVMVVSTAWFQSGVFVYWISTNMATITQTLLLRQPALRSFAGLPPLPAVRALPAPAPGAAASGGLLANVAGGLPAGMQGLLGMSPTQAAQATPVNAMAPPPREAIVHTTDVSLAGSRPPPSAPAAQPTSTTSRQAKSGAKAKKRRRR